MKPAEFFTALGKDQVRLRVVGNQPTKLDWRDDYSQPENHDVYFVVNDGGDKADEITRCRAFFVEWDDKPIEWQLSAWQELQLPEPTLQVLTGNKSVHNYWVLDEPCPVGYWCNIQVRLIEYCGSDPTLKDPSRVLRVPGFLHRKTGRPAEVVHHSDNRVTLQEMDTLLPLIEEKKIQRRITCAEPGTLGEIKAAFDCIPPRPGSGSGTYPMYRNIAWGLVAACEAAGETRETAIELLEAAGWADIDVRHVAEYSADQVTAGTFWYWAYQHGYHRPLRIPKQVASMTGEPWVKRLGWIAPEEGKLVKPTPLQIVTSLRALGDAFKWNDMDNHIYVDGDCIEDMEMSHAYIDVEECGIKVSKDIMVDCICKLAREHRYHPVRDYLDSCNVPLPDEMWDNICQVLLGGEPTEFDNSMLRKWLIGAVARAYQPGAAFGHVHVLSGEGMGGKTRFFQELASDEWFLEGFSPSNNPRDDAMKMHRKWVVEWGELDASISGKSAGATKNMLSVKSDSLRVPYGRGVEDFGRPFVLCGTTNRSDGFFVDETGNRRFVVYEVREHVDFEKVRSMRDSIWASAKRAYQDGAIWWPTQEEKAISEQLNNTLMEEDSWTELIRDNYMRVVKVPDGLGALPYIRSTDVLTGVLGVPPAQHTTKLLTRVNRALVGLGFIRTRCRVNGRFLKIFRLPPEDV